VCHARRAGEAALAAVLAEHGWAKTSDRCADLFEMLRAHDLTPPQEVMDAAARLDDAERRADPESADGPPSETCTDETAGECLDGVKRIRNYVNAMLTR
jgi:HEPN domain-containing protein